MLTVLKLSKILPDSQLTKVGCCDAGAIALIIDTTGDRSRSRRMRSNCRRPHFPSVLVILNLIVRLLACQWRLYFLLRYLDAEAAQIYSLRVQKQEQKHSLTTLFISSFRNCALRNPSNSLFVVQLWQQHGQGHETRYRCRAIWIFCINRRLRSVPETGKYRGASCWQLLCLGVWVSDLQHLELRLWKLET